MSFRRWQVVLITSCHCSNDYCAQMCGRYGQLDHAMAYAAALQSKSSTCVAMVVELAP